MAELLITGDKKLQRQFRALKGGAQRKIMRPALRNAAKPIVKMARSLVPKDERALEKSIGTQINTYKTTGSVIVRIGARSGYFLFDGLRKKDPIHYTHLVEFGTVNTPPRPFLRPAMDSNKNAVKAIINKTVGQGIRKELARTK